MTDLTKTQLELLERIETILNNMSCVYAIRKPDGTILGDAKLVTRTSKKAPLKFPRNTIKNYFVPMVSQLKDGESVIVPYDKFEPGALQSTICSHLTRHWGVGTYVTTRRPDENGVEVLRSGGI